jgi:hypothetical protein
MFCHLVLNHPHKDKDVVGVCHRPDVAVDGRDPLPVGYILIDLQVFRDLGFEWEGSPSFLFDQCFDLFHVDLPPEDGPLYGDYQISPLTCRILYAEDYVVVEDAWLVPWEDPDGR